MAEWTAEDVQKLAPEFATVPAPTISDVIALAEQFVNPNALGQARAKLAGSALTAHLLTVYAPAGVTPAAAAPGPIQSQTVGAVSVTYAVAAASPADVRSTLGDSKYGRLYQQIVRWAGLGVAVT